MERSERLKAAEIEYLEVRQKQIDRIARDKQEKNEQKAAYLYKKAAQRAAMLREKHEKQEHWERLEDQRTQANLKSEHARDVLTLEHIEALRALHKKAQEEAEKRKA